MDRSKAAPGRFLARFGAGLCALLLVATAVVAVRAQERSGALHELHEPHELDDAALIQYVEAALRGDAPASALPIKCLVPHLVEMEARGFDLDALPLAAAATELEYFETADGHFRIEYATTGLDSVDVTDADLSGVPDYVEWVGEAMQESWAYEVGQLGFPPIPLAASERYRVALKRASGYYGYTNFRNVTDPGGSNIVINADFAAFYRAFPSLVNDDPDGAVRGAIRVTCAHEFKHALQISAGWNVGETPLWVEVDATAMEDLVYDQVNDYYNYITQTGSPFVSPQTSLLQANYDDATWHLFLAEHYGTGFLTAFSAYRAAQPLVIAPEAYEDTAAQLQIGWQGLWREYAVWNFLTGTRTTASRGFGEAGSYPTAPTQTIGAVPLGPANFVLAPWANRFHVYNNAAGVLAGGLRVIFGSSRVDGWGVSLVLQNADTTVVLPLMVTSTSDTLETDGLSVRDFERIAVVVGNARVATNPLQQDPYTLTLERFRPPTWGSIKQQFRGTQQ